MRFVNEDINDRVINNKLLLKSSDFTKRKISIESVCWFLMGSQLLIANIAKHSSFYQIFGFLFILVCFVYLLSNNAIKFSKFYFISAFFILYNIFLIVEGIAIDGQHSFNMVKTISINLILFVMIYSFLIYIKDTEKLIKIYIYISAVSNAITLLVFKESLFNGRLAFSFGPSINTYNLFGFELTTAGPNGIAYFSSIAFLFSTYFFLKKESKVKYFFLDILFLFTILATGSRKGIFILIFGLILMLNILNKGNKKLIYVTCVVIFCVFLYILTQAVPVLYEVIGSRIEELINFILGKSVNDASINTRVRLIEMAVMLFKDRPIFGYGLDAFRILCPWNIISDNNYLDILVSSGLIGFIIYYSYAIFVVHDYLLIKEKSDICKILFYIFLLTLLIEYGSVTYFERNFGFINAMLYYILYKEREEKVFTKIIKVKL